ncbi:MAG: hypothetical protein SFW09_14445 [Hyphomicrobiaceae bacterium]|nr:hypothetical protein [Hyphomicrobiaceae bacterium]
MMRAFTITMTLGAALSLAACANDQLIGGTSTAALPPKPAIDPACAALASQIDQMRKDGVVDRVEAAAKGKGTTVSVKRDSLGKIAQLEKVNAEFQAKCSTLPRTAAVAPPPPPANAAPVKAAAVGAKTVDAAKAAPAKAVAPVAPAAPKQ